MRWARWTVFFLLVGLMCFSCRVRNDPQAGVEPQEPVIEEPPPPPPPPMDISPFSGQLELLERLAAATSGSDDR